MRELFDKLMLTSLIVIIFINGGDFVKLIVIACFAPALSLTPTLLQATKVGVVSGYVTNLVISFGAIMSEETLYFLPLTIYDAFYNKEKKQLIAPAIAIAMRIGSNMSTSHHGKLYIFLSLILLCCMGAKLGYNSIKLDESMQLYMETRDNDAEITMLLREKNQSIIENQENQIRIATLTERGRIAREIHDNLGHSLSRAILLLGATMAVNKDEKEKERLELLKETLDNAMTEVRSSVHNLRDSTVGLEECIENVISAMREKYKIDLTYDIEIEPSAPIKTCFIAIVKESMSNIIKHSNCDTIMIVLREHPLLYQLVIHDNGKSGAEIKQYGMGLESMRERVETLGGYFRIDNSDGFKIFVSIKK